MKIWNKVLCIFLSVVILFFTVNNSYFSPHKMDEVQASSIVVGGTVIAVETIIEVIAVLSVIGLSVGVIVEWNDIDLEAVLEDFHTWLKDHIGVLDSFGVDGTSALKEWAEADEWVVIEGGGGSNPEPSPSPEISGKHGAGKIWPAGTTWTIGNLLAAGGILAEEVYNKAVSVNPSTVEVCKSYMQDKISDVIASGATAATDPISQAIASHYVSDKPVYTGDTRTDIAESFTVNWHLHTDFDPDGFYYNVASGSALVGNGRMGFYKKYTHADGYNCYESFGMLANGQTFIPSLPGFKYKYGRDDVVYGTTNIKLESFYAYPGDLSTNVPIFDSYDDLLLYLNTGDDSACINRERENNYIDTNDDYGWASTAGFTLSDLAQGMPQTAEALEGRDVSLSGILAAVNALKSGLDSVNPNKDKDPATDPVVFPTAVQYTDTVKNVVTDPDIFPNADPSLDPDPGSNPDPGTDPDPDTDSSSNYSGFLGIIINLLKSILQAIKDFFAFFIIDFPAIKAHILAALDSIPAFNQFDFILGYFEDFKASVSDSYEYPVIAVDTPDILKPYYKSARIILVDFEDYATYFIWGRTFIAFSICFGMLLWVLKQFKVEFTVN